MVSVDMPLFPLDESVGHQLGFFPGDLPLTVPFELGTVYAGMVLIRICCLEEQSLLGVPVESPQSWVWLR